MSYFPKPLDVNRWGHAAIWNMLEAAHILVHIEPNNELTFLDPEAEQICDLLSRAAHVGFPQPFRGVGQYPLFLPLEVITWFEQIGREIDPDLKAAVIKATRAFVEHNKKMRANSSPKKETVSDSNGSVHPEPVFKFSETTKKALKRLGSPHQQTSVSSVTELASPILATSQQQLKATEDVAKAKRLTEKSGDADTKDQDADETDDGTEHPWVHIARSEATKIREKFPHLSQDQIATKVEKMNIKGARGFIVKAGTIKKRALKGF